MVPRELSHPTTIQSGDADYRPNTSTPPQALAFTSAPFATSSCATSGMFLKHAAIKAVLPRLVCSRARGRRRRGEDGREGGDNTDGHHTHRTPWHGHVDATDVLRHAADSARHGPGGSYPRVPRVMGGECPM